MSDTREKKIKYQLVIEKNSNEKCRRLLPLTSRLRLRYEDCKKIMLAVDAFQIYLTHLKIVHIEQRRSEIIAGTALDNGRAHMKDKLIRYQYYTKVQSRAENTTKDHLYT